MWFRLFSIASLLQSMTPAGISYLLLRLAEMLGLITTKVQEVPVALKGRRASRIKSFLKRPWIFLENTLPDGLALRMLYYRSLGQVLHLRNPRTFTEKIQWLKLKYRLPIVRRLADKYLAREYVAERIGPEVLNDLYGVWDRPADIDFPALPQTFALKVSSASHANIFCRDKSKLNFDDVRNKLSVRMCVTATATRVSGRTRDSSLALSPSGCWKMGQGQSPADYKFSHCFNGKPEPIEADIGRHEELTITLLDPQWNVLPCSYNFYPSQKKRIPRPKNLDEMMSYANILSKDFPFARIDFYSIRGKTVFGEITWYPSTGLNPFQPMEFNEHAQRPVHFAEHPVSKQYCGMHLTL